MSLNSKRELIENQLDESEREALLELVPPTKEEISLEDWPKPEPLPQVALLPVVKLPPAIIPTPLRPWLTDVAYRMQCPLDFVAAGAMVTLSSIIGAGCAIRPKKHDDWTVIPNLWGGVVARPSMLKSPSLAEIMKPVNKLEGMAKEQFEMQEAFAEADKEAYKAQRAAIISEMTAVSKGKPLKGKPLKTIDALKEEYAGLEEPDEPTRRRYKTSDTTVEKLGELLNQNERGILIFRDELTGLLTSWDREDRQSDRAFYLEAWNGGQPYSTDRIGRGTIDVKSCCVSILGGIQPSKLLAYLIQASDSLQNDGMVQRFQVLVYPDELSWDLIDEKPNLTARNNAHIIFDELANMNFETAGAIADDDRPFFRFDDNAQEVFYEWLTGLQAKIASEESPLIAEHLAKYRSLMPSIALIIHLVSIAAGGSQGAIPVEAAEMAAAWCSYLESHARRIYGLLSGAEEQAALALVKKLKDGKLKEPFSLWDIYHNDWQFLNSKEKAETACLELVELGWIRQENIQTPHRPGGKIRFVINPKIKNVEMR